MQTANLASAITCSSIGSSASGIEKTQGAGDQSTQPPTLEELLIRGIHANAPAQVDPQTLGSSSSNSKRQQRSSGRDGFERKRVWTNHSQVGHSAISKKGDDIANAQGIAKRDSQQASQDLLEKYRALETLLCNRPG